MPAIGVSAPLEAEWGNEEPVRRELERRVKQGILPKPAL